MNRLVLWALLLGTLGALEALKLGSAWLGAILALAPVITGLGLHHVEMRLRLAGVEVDEGSVPKGTS